jgi:signal transduction histidine kinase
MKAGIGLETRFGNVMQKEQLKEDENVRFRILTEVSQQITSILEIDDLLTRIVRLIQQTFGYYHVGIGLIERDDVVYRVGAGDLWDDPDFQFKPSRLKIGSEGLTGWVAGSGQVAFVPDVTQDAHYVWMRGSLTRSELVVPITVKGQTIGVLDAQSEQLNGFDQIDVEMLQALANQAGIAIENVRLHEQAKQVAILEERQRLARDLHDSVTQSLYGLNLYAQAASGHLALGQLEHVQQHLDDIQKTAQESLTEIRLLIYELRPLILEQEGLIAALQNRLYSVESRAELKSNLKSNLKERLPLEVEEGLYRIAQEALNNTIKHAQAKRVEVRVLRENGTVSLEISDDGKGFDPTTAYQEGCLGILSMRERASVQNWDFRLDSDPGVGTRIRVEVRL